MSNVEQTLSIIKPDAVERNLENEIKEVGDICLTVLCFDSSDTESGGS